MFGETYHSTRGALGEARHVFIEAGFNRASGEVVRVFEAGWGTGLNCWLTLLEAEMSGRAVEYVGVERYPVPMEVAASLGYSEDERFAAMHAAPWNEWADIAPGFRLLKVNGDLVSLFSSSSQQLICGQKRSDCATSEIPRLNVNDRAGKRESVQDEYFSPQIVYWDAFAPDTQPELWTQELFRNVYERMAPGGIFVTYSAKGTVKRALSAAGFEVERLPGALGKRHMLKARR